MESGLVVFARRVYRKLTGRPDAVLSDVPMHLLRAVFGPTHTVMVEGRPFTVNMDDNGVSARILFFRAFEERETGVVRKLVRSGDFAVDVGANIGWYTVLLGELVGLRGRVLAVEPEPVNATILRKNVERRGLSSFVSVAQVALGSASGEATLRLAKANKGDHRVDLSANGEGESDSLKIAVVTLDDLLSDWPRVDFVKMDVQGFEPYAFAGMQEILARSPSAAMLIEYWPYGIQAVGRDPLSFLKEIRSAGFQIWKITNDERILEVLAATDDGVFTEALGYGEVLEATPNLVCARSEERIAHVRGRS
jgi:FkbM family methyltransferase